jgi:hypothetical protein
VKKELWYVVYNPQLGWDVTQADCRPLPGDVIRASGSHEAMRAAYRLLTASAL